MTEVLSHFVEVCPFRILADRAEFLLLRRSAAEAPYPGIWQFVTGRVEEGEPAHRAALRELDEETGARPMKFWVVPSVSLFYDPAGGAVQQVPLFAAQLEAESAVRLSPEHSLALWLSYDEARRRLPWPGQRSCLEIVRSYILGGEEAGRLLELPL